MEKGIRILARPSASSEAVLSAEAFRLTAYLD